MNDPTLMLLNDASMSLAAADLIELRRIRHLAEGSCAAGGPPPSYGRHAATGKARAMLADARREFMRDPLTVADEISAEIHRIPTAVRRADALRAVERRDLHLSTARAAFLALGLPAVWVATVCDEAERLSEGK